MQHDTKRGDEDKKKRRKGQHGCRRLKEARAGALSAALCRAWSHPIHPVPLCAMTPDTTEPSSPSIFPPFLPFLLPLFTPSTPDRTALPPLSVAPTSSFPAFNYFVSLETEEEAIGCGTNQTNKSTDREMHPARCGGRNAALPLAEGGTSHCGAAGRFRLLQ